MKINENVQQAINEQLNHELHSAYLYLSMSAYLDRINLKGSAHWMRVQAQEELGHALKLYHFLVERLGEVRLRPVEMVPVEWSSPLDAFENAFAHEQKVSARIHRLVDLAQQEKDHATAGFLQWFVQEQVEEEASVDDVVQKLRMVADSKGGRYMLDRELGKRSAG